MCEGLIRRHEVVDPDPAEHREHERLQHRKADVEDPELARSGTDAFRQLRDLGPGELRLHHLPPTDAEARQDGDSEDDDPHPPEPLRELAPDSQGAVDVVEVGHDACSGGREPGHPLEVRIQRARELLASLEEVWDRRERGCEQPRERDDEEALADADATACLRGGPLHQEPESTRHDPRDHEGQWCLPVPERERDREERGETQVLSERRNEVEDGKNVDGEATRRADPRDGVGQLREPRRPTERSLPR